MDRDPDNHLPGREANHDPDPNLRRPVEALIRRGVRPMPSSVTRYIIFLGAIGVGKTTLCGCTAGLTGEQRLQLDSDTRGIRAYEYSARELEEVSGIMVQHNYVVFDCEGFTGDQKTDIFILHDILARIKLEVTKVNAIYYCISANRLRHGDEQSLRLVVDHAGQDFVDRLKFVLTNAPEALVAGNETRRDLRDDAHQKLRAILGRYVPPTDLIVSNLIDPNQFQPNSALRRMTEDDWEDCKVAFHRRFRELNDALRLKSLTFLQRIKSIVWIYRQLISLYLFVLLLMLLILLFMKYYFDLTELIRGNEVCKLIIEESLKEERENKSTGPFSFITNLFRKQ